MSNIIACRWFETESKYVGHIYNNINNNDNDIHPATWHHGTLENIGAIIKEDMKLSINILLPTYTYIHTIAEWAENFLLTDYVFIYIRMHTDCE